VRYLAILKDSLLEAVDTKVMYVMLALSGILIIGAASLSFTPQSCQEIPNEFTIASLEQAGHKSAQKKARFVLPGFGWFGSSTTWTQQSVEPMNGAPDEPDSPLRFVLRRTFPSKEEAIRVQQAPGATEEFIRENFATHGDWKIFQVTAVKLLSSSGGRDLSFEVETRPTSATRRAWPHQPNLFFGSVPVPALKALPLGVQVWMIEDSLVNNFGGWVALLISVILTAFFIPNMLRKGTIDLLLVKPIRRTALLAYKYVGGLTFIFLNTTVAVGGVWLVIGLRSGIWSTGFLLTILLITFFFAILYSVSTLMGVLTQSPIVAILVTCLAWLIFYVVGVLYTLPDILRMNSEQQRAVSNRSMASATSPNAKQQGSGAAPSPDSKQAEENPEPTWFTVFKVLHFVTPRTSDLKYLTSRLLLNDTLKSDDLEPNQLETATFSWSECLAVNGIFIAAMLGLACLRFAYRDF
jgi:ABC-type transport system involved in multi-copper enzyme maturation permease subunit